MYQAVPSEATMTSCGCASLLGRLYSVTIMRGARPVGRGSGLRRHCCLGRVGFISDGPYAERIISRLQPVFWKAVSSLLIRRYRDSDCRAGFLGADEDALHGAFLLRAHAAAERGLGGCL